MFLPDRSLLELPADPSSSDHPSAAAHSCELSFLFRRQRISQEMSDPTPNANLSLLGPRLRSVLGFRSGRVPQVPGCPCGVPVSVLQHTALISFIKITRHGSLHYDDKDNAHTILACSTDNTPLCMVYELINGINDTTTFEGNERP